MKTIILFALIAVGAAGDIEVYQRQFRDGVDQFTTKMFSEVVRSNPGKSAVLSAFSVLPPLAQLSLAAVGESHDELLNAIGLQNDNVTRAVFPALTRQLQSLKGVELKLANKVYVAKDYEINEQFEVDTKHLFDSEIQNIDFFKNKETANEINEWIENKTNSHIKGLLNEDSLQRDTRTVLVNAIYFKGSWKKKFNKNATRDRDFHVSAEKTIKVPTMFKIDSFKYNESKELDSKLLEMPYEGAEASLLIVLPNDIEGLPILEERLRENPALLKEALKYMYSTKVDVYLPKFKTETTTDLKKVLQKMDVTKIFEKHAARLESLIKTDEPLYISGATQKAFIEVNEEGAEAAAANAFPRIPLRSAKPKVQRRIFDANRPFLYRLKVNQGPVIFSGVYYG